MRLTIENILRENYDSLKRNESGTIEYDSQFKQVTENLLKHQSMDSSECQTYDKFFNVLLNESYEMRSVQKIYSIPENKECKCRYVNDVITRDIWTNWKFGNNVFISAGTGRGKNTFIKKELLKHIGNARVIIFENRDSLMQQQIRDIVSEIDPDALKYQDISKESMVTFNNKNMMVISYQKAALKLALNDSRFWEFCQSARYFIFDEAHYIIDDAGFNKGINFFVNTFLRQSAPNAIKIFMSGSMEEFYTFLQMIQPFTTEPNDIYKEKEMIDIKGDDISYHFTRDLVSRNNGRHVLSMPTDYSYIKPYKYKELTDICSQIAQTAIDEKWLIFVKSIEEGSELKSALKSICGDSVCFLSADNKKSDENSEIYNGLIHNSMFDCRVLIATTVIYNGINIKDKAVKHIVVPFTTVSVVKQLIGRKRVDEGETVNVYFHDTPYNSVKKVYRNLVKEYMEYISLSNGLAEKAMIQLNKLSHSEISKYYYLQQKTFIMPDNRKIYCLEPFLNEPAAFKLYFNTCFYIFALQRMNPELGEKAVSFVYILMKHLGIAEKYDVITDISVKPEKEKIEEMRQQLSDYLENLIDSPVVVPDENGSYNELLELKKIINEAHKALHNKNLDTQWKNPDRFFSEEKVKALLSELSLPYKIKNEGTKEKRTVTVTKDEL